MAFQEILAAKAGGPVSGPEPLAALPYEQELACKREALAAFWKTHNLPGRPLPVTAAARPREYRATGKRRVGWLGPGRVAIDHGTATRPGVCPPSLLEPPIHQELYLHCHGILCRTAYQSLARALHWITVRGNDSGRSVILVVDRLDGPLVRQAKHLAESLPTLGITAAMLYVDPTRSAYYLEAERPIDGLATKHLYGPRLLTLTFDDAGITVRLKYPPTAFSQVNEAMIPTLVAAARELLAPHAGDHLLDLYCGYGLFAFTLGAACRHVCGIEATGVAVEAARETARRQNREGRFRFLAARIDGPGIAALLPAPPPGGELLVLDPPRHGSAPGVIEALAARLPKRVLHIACGTDELVPAIAAWNAAGYRVESAWPLDLFPGTCNLETLVLLVPS